MQKLIRAIEAALFVSSRPLSARELAEVTGSPEEDVAAALAELASTRKDQGVVLADYDGDYQLVTAPDLSPQLEAFLQTETAKPLSSAALETLAIVAHHQPATQAQIETIRGVASDQTIQNLVGRGLIVQKGRSGEPGRPRLYALGPESWRKLGVTDSEKLKKQLESDAD